MTPLLIRHLMGEPIGRFPVWMMRQAGRYLPRYREIRSRVSFWESVTNPKVAVELTELPLEVLNVDALILFSDILTLPYSVGVPVEMKESVGPCLAKPFRKESDFSCFQKFEPKHSVPYVGEALSSLRKKLDPQKALIGFAGAPWTVACYLIEGQGRSDFLEIKKWLHKDPENLNRVLETLALATTQYLEYQIDSGADLIQVFDTWLMQMPRAFFMKYYRATLVHLFNKLREFRKPVIYYSRQSSHLLSELSELPVLLSIDASLSLTDFETLTRKKFSLQGNLDPAVLLLSESDVRRETRQLVAEACKLSLPPILNLGHGILPQTPLENAIAFVEEATQKWV